MVSRTLSRPPRRYSDAVAAVGELYRIVRAEGRNAKCSAVFRRDLGQALDVALREAAPGQSVAIEQRLPDGSWRELDLETLLREAGR